MKKSCIMLAVMCLILPMLLGDGDLFVKSKYADVNTKRSKKSAVIAELERGTKVDQISFKKKWYKISYDGKEGWIHQSKVAPGAPAADSSLTASGGNALASEQLAAGSAIRGLSDLGHQFAGHVKLTPQQKEVLERYVDYHQSHIAVSKLADAPKLTAKNVPLVQIERKEIRKFLEDGKLGEYQYDDQED